MKTEQCSHAALKILSVRCPVSWVRTQREFLRGRGRRHAPILGQPTSCAHFPRPPAAHCKQRVVLSTAQCADHARLLCLYSHSSVLTTDTLHCLFCVIHNYCLLFMVIYDLSRDSVLNSAVAISSTSAVRRGEDRQNIYCEHVSAAL